MKIPFNKQILSYILFGVIILIVFLYLRFPGRVVSDYITSAASAQNPEAVLVIGAVKPYFPPGLKMENIAYGVKRNPDATMHMDNLTARLGFLNMFKRETTLLLKGDSYGGTLQGHVDFAEFLSLSKPVNYEMKISGVALDKFAFVKGTFNRNITGKLNSSFVYRRSYERIGEGNGTGEFTIMNGSYQLLEKILGFESIDFSKIEGHMSIKGGTLKIDRMKLTGAKFNCSLQGDIVLNKDIDLSPITMNGAIEIAGLGGKRMNIAIGGILSNPTVRLMQ